MADEALDFIREFLRRMDEKLDRVLARVDELAFSVSGPLQIAAAHGRHLERLDQRAERIEKRMELMQA
jgi:archaellum component FlaC